MGARVVDRIHRDGELMRQGFNDDQNNPRYNFVPHPYDPGEPATRGTPAAGNIATPIFVSEDQTIVGSPTQCVAVEPDPSLFGDGTWFSLDRAGLSASHEVALTQSVSLLS